MTTFLVIVAIAAILLVGVMGYAIWTAPEDKFGDWG